MFKALSVVPAKMTPSLGRAEVAGSSVEPGSAEPFFLAPAPSKTSIDSKRIAAAAIGIQRRGPMDPPFVCHSKEQFWACALKFPHPVQIDSQSLLPADWQYALDFLLANSQKSPSGCFNFQPFCASSAGGSEEALRSPTKLLESEEKLAKFFASNCA